MKHIYETKCPVDVRGYYGGSALGYPDFQLPKGLKCTPSGMQGQFFLDQFPKEIFPLDSGLRHDAEHYGIFIDAENVVDVTPPPMDIPFGKEISPSALVLAMIQAQKETLVPFASKRHGFYWTFFSLRTNGTYRVERRHDEVLQLTVLYDGADAFDAVTAWNSPNPGEEETS